MQARNELTIGFAVLTAFLALAGVGDKAQTGEPHNAGVKEKTVAAASQATKPQRTNRLEHETSPYLLQHAHNPVDWYPWGEEALKRARDEDKPIFLSIGYSACHWCHVMERESFEDEQIAEYLNAHFVSIKVDREERPDLDEIYMTAVQIMTGSGGWPMTVFLTPDLKPFYGGTYFPPRDAFGRPGFMSLLTSIAQSWDARRPEIARSADQLTQYVRQSVSMRTGAATDVTSALIEQATKDLAETYDPRDGGFGGAPKFPSSPAIALLLRQYVHTKEPRVLDMATFTLKKMCEGGMYDHLGGGFHRYSVDAQWLVPHFEKMLYDNAQLVQVYLEAYQLTDDPLFARVVRETLDYELREMQDPRGAFHSTEDADSEGQEGKFYIWTMAELMSILGEDDGKAFCSYYGVRSNGNFDSHEHYHEGTNILHVTRSREDVAAALSMSIDDLNACLARSAAKLLAVRSKRVRPGLDDKVLTSWNGLMISALAQGYQVLGEVRYREAAERAADFVLTQMLKDGVLLRTYRNGESRVPGYLDDYAFMAVALTDLYEATFDLRWLEAADAFAKTLLDQFWDPNGGGFFFTTADHRDVLLRTKPTYDGAEPSGNSMAAFALLRLAKLTDNKTYAGKGEEILRSNHVNMESASRGYLKLLCVADFYLSPAKEIAIVGESGSEPVQSFLRTLHGEYIPNKVIALLDPASTDAARVEARVPLLAAKALVGGEPAVYVCKDYACQQPVTTGEGLLKALGITEPKKAS
ncbi:MAG: thioredoxin domain-containing protein [Candidatus Hydrogenedentales bacterium]|jgi:hypothetical protein